MFIPIFVYFAIQVLSLVDISSEVSNKTLRTRWTYDDCQCGIKRAKIANYKIVGGRNAVNGEFPWLAAIYKVTVSNQRSFKRLICGGVLVNSATVFTAAHCVLKYVEKPYELKIILDSLNLYTGSEEFRDYVAEVAFIAVPTNYIDRQPYDDDFAIIKLAVHVDFNYFTNIVPICLPQKESRFENLLGETCGWGAKRFGGTNSKHLQTVSVHIIGRDDCIQFNGDALASSAICAGDTYNGGKDSCTGDSGGPLSTVWNEKSILVGISSSGFGCGETSRPGMYTEITSNIC